MKIKTRNALVLIMVVVRGRGGCFASNERVATVQNRILCLFVEVQNIHVTFPTNEETTEFPSHPV